jgi:hypothetical protein
MLDIHGDQLHANPVLDADAVKPALQHSFNRHIEKPNPIAFGRGSSKHSIKLLTNSRFKQERSPGFTDLPFNFVGSILSQALSFLQSPLRPLTDDFHSFPGMLSNNRNK